jgi:hypothetical protein
METEADILFDRQVGKQEAFLKDHSDPALIGAERAGIVSMNPDPPRIGRLKPRDNPEQGRFPAATWGKQRKNLALRNIETDTGKYR